tara:strand:+ start:576 stop:1052 length:477 start_codon:yes stop_codon:yes gene_type:complete
MEGMTPEEKNAVMQFMGQTYGEAHKNDGMMVSPSSNLKPSAEQAKRVFEQTARIPTVRRNGQPNMPPPPANVGELPPGEQASIQPVSPEQAAQEIAAQRAIRTEQPPVVEEVDPNQVEFDFSEPAKIDQLIDLIKDQNLILKDIRLKLSDGKNAKSKK